MAAAVDRSEKNLPIIPWWLVLLEGLALIAIGVMLLIQPGITTTLLIRFLGFYWLIKGFVNIIGIFFDHRLWGWKLFVAIVSIWAGLLIINSPIVSTLLVGFSIIILMGILAIVVGVGNLIEAFSRRWLGYRDPWRPGDPGWDTAAIEPGDWNVDLALYDRNPGDCWRCAGDHRRIRPTEPGEKNETGCGPCSGSSANRGNF